MPKVRPISELAEKWKTVTPAREPYYERGVSAPKENWAEEAIAAEGAWEKGVSDAVARKAFAKGVAATGVEGWKAKTLEKGVRQGRWRSGITAYADEYAKGFAPYRDVIEAVVLPPKGAKGDPRNIDRVKAIATALFAKRMEKYK